MTRAADSIDGAFVPARAAGVAAVEVDDELVLAAAAGAGGEIYTHWLNPTGALVWANFDGETSLDELAAELADVFSVDLEIVAGDLLALTQALGRVGLLEGVDADVPAIEMRLPTLPIGTDVSLARVTSLDGEQFVLGDRSGNRVLLVNWSPTCGFCAGIADELEALRPALAARDIELLLVTGDIDVFRGLGTPSAYLVDADGRTASHLALGAKQVPGLAGRAAQRNG